MITNSKAYNVTLRIWQVGLRHFGAHIILIILDFYSQVRGEAFVPAGSLAYVPSERIFLDCGSSAEQSLWYKGRNWSSDIGTHFIASNSDSNSTVSSASKGTTVPGVPYMTARLFHTKFSYTFNVTPGPKFIRLHFYSDSYGDFNASESFLTVTSGHYTLLRNFSSYLTAKNLKVDYFFKEFIVHVENCTLELTFSPASNAPNAYGFVNGVEIVSMPLRLYLRGDDVPLPFVGFNPNVLTFGNNFALEMVYRANVGGQTISPDRDTGMFRTWNGDESYIFGAAFGQLDYDLNLSIQYPKTVPAYTAPGDVYRTARSMGQNNEINNNYNLSWFFPVDTGFLYLIRLHFCEIVPGMTLENQRVFFIFINNRTAETQADVLVWSKGHGVPVYRDYVVMIPPQAVGKQDLWLELHPNIRVKPNYYDAILNGLEIFKISNYDGNLAGLNPPLDESNFPRPSPAPSTKSKKRLRNQITYPVGGAFVLLVLFLFALLLVKTRRNWKMKKPKDSSHCRSFSNHDMRKATNNFDESLVIIDMWSSGKVFKGCINGTEVAILRGANAISEQVFNEVIKMLSQIHHHNIVPLLGYCQGDPEKILVYEYMDNGTLSDHLHHHLVKRKKPLSWNQRLEICVGVARGLHYLLTGKKCPIKHCALNGKSFIRFESITFRRTKESTEKKNEMQQNTGLVEAIIVDVKDREKIGGSYLHSAAICCTPDLSKEGSCKVGEVIIHQDPNYAYNPQRIQTFFEGKNEETTMVLQTVEINRTGMYYLYFMFCDPELTGTMISGRTVWKNPEGYLPGKMAPLMTFFGLMSLAYLGLGVVWFLWFVQYWKDIIQLQYHITAVIGLGMCEMALWYFEYANFNATGSRPMGITLWAVTFSAVKKTVSRLLLLVVSMGYGVVRPTLGGIIFKVLLLGLTYFVFSEALGLVENLGNINDLNGKARLFLVLPVSLLDACFIVWIFSALSQTLAKLQVRKSMVKFALYRGFTNSLAISVLVSIAWVGYELYFNAADPLSELWQRAWIIPAFWNLLAFVLLIVICILWAPSNNPTRYAYSEETGDELEEEGISLTSSSVILAGESATKLERKERKVSNADLFGLVEELEEDKRE